MKKIIIGFVLGSIAFASVSSAAIKYTADKGIVLVNWSDDNRVAKYYDYDGGVTCYALGIKYQSTGQYNLPSGISCVK